MAGRQGPWSGLYPSSDVPLVPPGPRNEGATLTRALPPLGEPTNLRIHRTLQGCARTVSLVYPPKFHSAGGKFVFEYREFGTDEGVTGWISTNQELGISIKKQRERDQLLARDDAVDFMRPLRLWESIRTRQESTQLYQVQNI